MTHPQSTQLPISSVQPCTTSAASGLSSSSGASCCATFNHRTAMFSAWHQRPLVKLGKLFRIYRKIWEDMGNHELIPQKNIACFFASRGTSTWGGLGGKIYRKPVFYSSNIRVFLQMFPSTKLWTNEKSWANPIDAFCNSWYAVGLSNGICVHSVDANPSILR